MFPWGNYNALVVLRDGDAGHDENSVDQLCQPKKDKDKDVILMNGDGGTWRGNSEITYQLKILLNNDK